MGATSKRHLGVITFGVITFATMLAIGGTASAQYPPIIVDTAACDSSTAPQGGSVNCEVTGWEAQATVEIWITSLPRHIVTVQADLNGDLTQTVEIPSDLPPGQHHIEFRGRYANGDPRTVRFPITVTSAGGGGSGPDLPPAGDPEDSAPSEGEAGNPGATAPPAGGGGPGGTSPATGVAVPVWLALGLILAAGGIGTFVFISRRRPGEGSEAGSGV